MRSAALTTAPRCCSLPRQRVSSASSRRASTRRSGWSCTLRGSRHRNGGPRQQVRRVGASRVPRLRDESASLVRPDLLAFRNAFSMRPFLTKRLLSRWGPSARPLPLSLVGASEPDASLTSGQNAPGRHGGRVRDPRALAASTRASRLRTARRRQRDHQFARGDAHFHLCPLVRARASADRARAPARTPPAPPPAIPRAF